jgi:hypothetical protein
MRRFSHAALLTLPAGKAGLLRFTTQTCTESEGMKGGPTALRTASLAGKVIGSYLITEMGFAACLCCKAKIKP